MPPHHYQAMILAAGRGERMRPLTDHTPKPLLKVAGKALIEYHIEALAKGGIRRILINHAHLGAQIPAALGDGARWGVELGYSPEPPGALNTGGGIFHALERLDPAGFLVINGDIWLDDYPFERLSTEPHDLAALLLVANPPQHPSGDFHLDGARVSNQGQGQRLTFSGLGRYRPQMFAHCSPGAFPLAPLLRQAADAGRVTGIKGDGDWQDIGTPQRLAQLDQQLRENHHGT